MIIIDEGQKILTIGQTVKLIVDHFKSAKQVVVTGSSSIHLLNQTEETLTGRKYVYTLYPLSWEELYPTHNQLALHTKLDQLLVFGQYPEVAQAASFGEKEELLRELVRSYLYKDILELHAVKHADALVALVKALALQIGSQVSYTELGRLTGLDKNTVTRYITLLEQAYVIFRLSPFSVNKRNEIVKLKKVYFFDVGVRNAIINNFNFPTERADAGALWENLLMVERLKYREYHDIYANQYFWRTYDGQEIDLVEERGGHLYGYEYKWNERKQRTSPPPAWQAYPDSSYTTITKANVQGFVF